MGGSPINTVEDTVSQAIVLEQQLTQYHVPGFNYMGPGTRIITNLRNKIKPVNFLDSLSRQHDVDYIKELDNSDLRAIERSIPDQTILGQLFRAGLTTRYFTGMKFKDIYSGLDKELLTEWANQQISDN